MRNREPLVTHTDPASAFKLLEKKKRKKRLLRLSIIDDDGVISLISFPVAAGGGGLGKVAKNFWIQRGLRRRRWKGKGWRAMVGPKTFILGSSELHDVQPGGGGEWVLTGGENAGL
ncbi:unnamed protein product [Boreogadus saida]